MTHYQSDDDVTRLLTIVVASTQSLDRSHWLKTTTWCNTSTSPTSRCSYSSNSNLNTNQSLVLDDMEPCLGCCILRSSIFTCTSPRMKMVHGWLWAATHHWVVTQPTEEPCSVLSWVAFLELMPYRRVGLTLWTFRVPLTKTAEKTATHCWVQLYRGSFICCLSHLSPNTISRIASVLAWKEQQWRKVAAFFLFQEDRFLVFNLQLNDSCSESTIDLLWYRNWWFLRHLPSRVKPEVKLERSFVYVRWTLNINCI